MGGDFLYLKGYNKYMETNLEINKKKLTIRILSIIFFIFILNAIASKLHWYYSIWYFDMAMHFLGGFWVGLAIIYFFKIKIISFANILKIFFYFLIIGSLWEVFEIIVDEIVSQNPFNTLDTFSDICFGLSGAFVSFFYFLKRIMIKEVIKL